MIIDKKCELEVGGIYGFRIPGSEFFAKVISVCDEKVVVDNPLQMVQTADGSLALAPVFPFAKESAPVVMSSVGLIYYETNDDIKTSFVSSSTGLVIPKQGLSK